MFGCGPSEMVVSDRPADPVYVRPVAPGPGYVWIDGDWYWRGGNYTYRRGYWAAPRVHRVYTPGTWHQRGSGWYRQRGGWHRH
jgi:WXXGXW repeat (2 copies)